MTRVAGIHRKSRAASLAARIVHRDGDDVVHALVQGHMGTKSARFLGLSVPVLIGPCCIIGLSAHDEIDTLHVETRTFAGIHIVTGPSYQLDGRLIGAGVRGRRDPGDDGVGVIGHKAPGIPDRVVVQFIVADHVLGARVDAIKPRCGRRRGAVPMAHRLPGAVQ